MSTWSINDQSFGALGLSDLRLVRVSRASDVCSFQAPGNLLATGLLAFGATAIIKRDGVPWFHGRVVSLPRQGSARGESIGYELRGPWHWLENIVYQQPWRRATGPVEEGQDEPPMDDIDESRLILGQDISGARVSTAAEIAAILDYAMDAGAPLQYAAIGADAQPPFDEAVDVSCAEAIQRMLAWTPDAVTWFDYTTTPPTLHIGRRAGATEVSLPIPGYIASVDITPREDLRVPGVILKYEREMEDNGRRWKSVVTDVAGDPDEKSFGALVATIQLMGGSRTDQMSYTPIEQKIRTRTIAHTDLDWWKDHIPWLRGGTGAGQIKSGTLSLVGYSSPNEFYPRELLSGTIQPWMDKLVSDGEFTGIFAYELVAGTRVSWHEIPITITTTDAVTKTYLMSSDMSSSSDVVEPEDVPTGLAAALYASLGVLHYDGQIVLTEPECSGSILPGMVLNITGGLSEWATMRALVQSVEHRIDAAQTYIRVGPPDHLGPQDLVSLMRANRQRRTSVSANAHWDRNTGKALPAAPSPSDGEQSSTKPAAAPGPASLDALKMGDATKSISIDKDELASGDHISVRPAKSGATAMKILSTPGETSNDPLEFIPAGGSENKYLTRDENGDAVWDYVRVP